MQYEYNFEKMKPLQTDVKYEIESIHIFQNQKIHLNDQNQIKESIIS